MLLDLKKLAKSTASFLSNSDAPENDAYELVRFVFGVDRTGVLLQPIHEVSEDKLQLFDALSEKRKSGYPLQYIIGEWDFLGHTFYIDDGVLVPRTETEQVADEADSFLMGKKNMTVLDLCTGSGCIGLTVAVNNPMCNVYISDISEKALSCAEKNIRRFALDNVTVLNYDIFCGFNEKVFPPFDVLLCNPPYVPEEELPKIQKEVTFEPHIAVDGGKGGMSFYGVLCENWLKHLKKGGFFMFESGEGQPEKILEMIDKERFTATAEDDICGICRFVKGFATE